MTIAPQALLFDLGGVIVDIDFQRAIDVWQRHSPLPAQEIERLFQFDAAYERHDDKRRGDSHPAGTRKLRHQAFGLIGFRIGHERSEKSACAAICD